MLDNLETGMAAGVTSIDDAPAVLLDYKLYPPRKGRNLVVNVAGLPCATMAMLDHPLVTLKRRGTIFTFSFATDAPVLTVYFREGGTVQ
jgi:hypothetical protein